MKLSVKVIGLVIAGAVASIVIAGSGVAAQDASAKCVDNTYRYGSGYSGGTANYCVKYIQRLSNGIERHSVTGPKTPGSTKLSVDGKFGSGTKNQIKNIQRNSYMQTSRGKSYLSVDGVVGKQTWAVLCGYGSFAISFNERKAIGCVDSRGYGFDQINKLYPRMF